MIPKHVAIIPDGNRRWARLHMLSLGQAYKETARRALDLVSWLQEKGVEEVSVFGASQENVHERSHQEVRAVMQAVLFFAHELKKNFPQVYLHIFGDLDGLPNWLSQKSAILQLNQPKPSTSPLTFNFGINYSGKAEIPALLHHLPQIPSQKWVTNWQNGLLSHQVPPVDLLIRTGGQQRLSGFLPFQMDYAELWFTPTYWPDFNKDEFEVAVQWFAQQKRNFGK